jgi:hypothetical protein
MTIQLNDHTDPPATVRLDDARPIGAYTVHHFDGTLAGKAYFMDSPDADDERIFFHTEVDEEFSGQGLGRLLVHEALADTIRKDLTVVPVCPLLEAQIKAHDAEFLADGGRFRQPTRADLALVTRLAASERISPGRRPTDR